MFYLGLCTLSFCLLIWFTLSLNVFKMYTSFRSFLVVTTVSWSIRKAFEFCLVQGDFAGHVCDRETARKQLLLFCCCGKEIGSEKQI